MNVEVLIFIPFPEQTLQEHQCKCGMSWEQHFQENGHNEMSFHGRWINTEEVLLSLVYQDCFS